MPSEIKSLLMKCSIRKRVSVREICLQKESQGFRNVPSKNRVMVRGMCFQNIISVREMCLQKESHGYGNVPSKKGSGLVECVFKKRAMVGEHTKESVLWECFF